MHYRAFWASALCLAGCGPTPPATTPAPPGGTTTASTTSAPAPAKGGGTSLIDAQRALTTGGHACKLADPSTLVCDKEDQSKPTLIVVYVRGNKVTRLAFASVFPWKQPGACAQAFPRLNELNQSSDLLKVFCSDEVMTWAAPLVVPQAGVGDDDINGFASWFLASVQAALRGSGLLETLK